MDRLSAQLKYTRNIFFISLIIALTCHSFVRAEDNNVAWTHLTESQKKVLNPLALEWDTLRPWQREKMLDIAHDYPKMTPEKQALVQKRLSNWSRMTPYERENARKKHQQFNALSPEKKAAMHKKWVEYAKLPEAEREKLRAESPEIYNDADLN